MDSMPPCPHHALFAYARVLPSGRYIAPDGELTFTLNIRGARCSVTTTRRTWPIAWNGVEHSETILYDAASKKTYYERIVDNVSPLLVDQTKYRECLHQLRSRRESLPPYPAWMEEILSGTLRRLQEAVPSYNASDVGV